MSFSNAGRRLTFNSLAMEFSSLSVYLQIIFRWSRTRRLEDTA